MSFAVQRQQLSVLAGSIACAGLTVAVGAFLGGYVLGGGRTSSSTAD